MTNLDIYRNDKDCWSDASYVAQSTKERGEHDANERERYSILLALQYDHNASDEELIRYLFRQEIIAREKDSFQGIGEALWLGAYLLATYRNVKDIPLFCRAKFANFDTDCGFDREFMFVALRGLPSSHRQESSQLCSGLDESPLRPDRSFQLPDSPPQHPTLLVDLLTELAPLRQRQDVGHPPAHDRHTPRRLANHRNQPLFGAEPVPLPRLDCVTTVAIYVQRKVVTQLAQQ